MTPTPPEYFDEATLGRCREAVGAVLGLRLEDNRRTSLASAVHERVRATRAPTVERYLERLAGDLVEQGELARLLVVPETSFLRNRDHFHALEAALRAHQRQGKRGLRLLSAGCSSGEEPYSLALIAREVLGSALANWHLEIVGIDLNPAALAAARAARYTRWSLREVPEALRRRFFHEAPADTFTLRDEVRHSVRFEQRNLLDDDPGFWRAGAFDVVFCRNVLMYFGPQVMRDIVARIATALVPGGLLFLGHAESLRGLSHDFHLVHAHDTFFYERRAKTGDAPAAPVRRADAPSTRPALEAPGSWSEAIAGSWQRLETLARGHDSAQSAAATALQQAPAERHDLRPALELLERERFDDALALLADLSPAATRDPELLLLRAALLVNGGDTAAAAATCEALLAVDALNAGAHYLMALCREHTGELDAAAEHDATSIHLDPDFAMPHLHLGLMARRRGDLEVAQRALERAAELLEREDPARLALFGGGFGRDGLVRLCRAELDACRRSP